jgi:hypothetical protein
VIGWINIHGAGVVLFLLTAAAAVQLEWQVEAALVNLPRDLSIKII